MGAQPAHSLVPPSASGRWSPARGNGERRRRGSNGEARGAPSGAKKGLPRKGKASSGRTLNTTQIPLVASHPDVYEPCDDSFALVDALLSDKAQLLTLQPRLCMEVGSGSGYVITSLVIMLRQLGSGAQYLAIDINQHATETTQVTLEAHGVHAYVIVTDIMWC
ncbi:S-adenosyl-L-methionine-dependent methyltransferase superfamily protein [Zea mays]|uniref:S-adenosyl-L-methionine-dependent methyltransferase superfamily protein n=1 Tax=Zea mays TaxID=4577 RepID=K7UYP4_MAIZE|nr:S-adenosyl-L-methionine-dependent methyltransferase superfamily protein [Zea mays]